MPIQSSTVRSLKVLGRIPLQKTKGFATMTSRTTHEERTAAERLEAGIHAVTLSRIEQHNSRVRILRLRPLRSKGDESMKARDLTQRGISVADCLPLQYSSFRGSG